MRFKLILTLLLFSICSLTALAQKQKKDEDKDEYDENYEFKETKTVNLNLGIGIGLDYGGIGGKITVLPTPHLGVFGAFGYNLIGLGYNVGVMGRILPDAKFCPYGSFMYGYNAVIVVDGMSSANNAYYGTSLGLGVEMKTRTNKFWNFEFVIPFRSQEYTNDLNALKNNPQIEMTEPLPFQISIGLHFPL